MIPKLAQMDVQGLPTDSKLIGQFALFHKDSVGRGGFTLLIQDPKQMKWPS